jgi:hypothetical protein
MEPFKTELQTKAVAHLRKHSPLMQNVSEGYKAVFAKECVIKYCAQPGRGLHRVWLPINSQFRQDAPDPATVKIDYPNPSGHTFYVHTHLHIQREHQPEPAKAPAAPQPPPPPSPAEMTPMEAAMDNLRAIANDCRTTPVHITMERMSRLLYSYKAQGGEAHNVQATSTHSQYQEQKPSARTCKTRNKWMVMR